MFQTGYFSDLNSNVNIKLSTKTNNNIDIANLNKKEDNFQTLASFEWLPSKPKTNEIEQTDLDNYKRIAVQKYLNNEINEDMLHTILEGLRTSNQDTVKRRDISYL